MIVTLLEQAAGLLGQTACDRKSFIGWTTRAGLYGTINTIAGIAILPWLVAAMSAACVSPAKHSKGTATCSRCWRGRCMKHSEAQQKRSNFENNSSGFHPFC